MSKSEYQNMGGMSYALEQDKKRRKRSRLIVLATVIVLVILIAGGVTAGVVISKNNSNNNSSGSAANKGTAKPNGDVDLTADNTNFKSDSRLRKSFYGIAYTPEGSLMPNCGNKLENVIHDIQLLSQLTTRIRLYGADCNQSALVLEAIQRTGVEMEVFLGNYILPDNEEVYLRQRDTIKDAIETYGVDHVAGITVGNEFMLNWVTAHQTTEVNGLVGNQGADLLVGYITDTRNMIASMGLSKPIHIGNSDAGSFFNTRVLSSVDYGLSNVHSWFANTTAAGGADWVRKFFDETNVIPAAALPNTPKMYIAETGWPTGAKDLGNMSNGGSTASVESLQAFIDAFLCQANAAEVPYFFFEFSDEKWKDDIYGGVEGHWGLFDMDRNLKDIVIPDCPPS